MKGIKKIYMTAILSVIVLLCVIAAAAFKSAPRANAELLTGRWLKSSSVNTSVNAKEGEFSIVVMGDQQIVLSNYSKYLAYSYDYIAKNKDEMNLKMFLNVGDIFDVVDFTDIVGGYNANDPYGRNRGTDPDTKYWFQQKEFVSEQVAKLEKANVPVALTMGNHDYEDMAFNYRINKTFNEAFPLSRFEKYAVGDSGVLDDTHYFGGAQYNDIEQAYYFFEGNGQKYMVLCLGIFPSDEMIDWANEVVASNPDCKVIVNTHAYFDTNGRPYERGDYLWNKFLSKHENIFMVVCGHDWEDGNIIKQIDYGENGNPVYQFMVNSQGEEFGGAGLFAQFIFRADGSVDCAYYAPAVEEYPSEFGVSENAGMYFGKESQFTFDTAISKISATEEGKSVSGRTVAGNSFYDDYVICSPDNGRWLKNVYEYKNVRIVSGKGLQATGEEGYITYKTEAEEFSRIKGLYITPDCKFTDGGAYQIDISEDGTEWKTVLFQSDVAGKTHYTFDVSRSLSGEKQLYIRLLLRGENFFMKAFEAEIKTIKTVLSDENGYFSAGFKAESATAANYNENMYAQKDLLLTEGDLLGSGGSGYLGGKGEIYYRFDAPENATFKTLSFSCAMRIERVPRTYSFAERKFDYNGTGEKLYSAAQTFGFKEKDSELALRILVSYDGGKSYEEQVTYNNADYAGANERFNYDIAVDGQKSVIVKLQFFGASHTDVGFKSLELNGTYERKESFYDTDGGTLYGDSLIPVKDGFVFDGWYLGGVKIDNPEAYKGMGVTLRANWKKIVSVIYVTGTAQNSPQNRTYLIEGETLALKDIALAGKTFAGWYDIGGKRYSSVTAGTDDIVLYAVFY